MRKKTLFLILFLILVMLLLIQGNVLGFVLCVPLIMLLAGNKTWVRHHGNTSVQTTTYDALVEETSIPLREKLTKL